MPDLFVGLATHEKLRAELIERWPELANDEETLSDTLEGISSFPDMIAAVVRSALEDERLVASLNEHIDKLRVRQRRFKERAERKRALALHYMQEGRLLRIAAPDLSASLGMSAGRVIITDEAALDMKWKRVITEPDRKALRLALKAGEVIDGAVLSNPTPTIRVTST